MTVKELRAKTTMSQSKFADFFEIPVRTIQKWEQAQSKPTDYMVKMMERILNHEYF